MLLFLFPRYRTWCRRWSWVLPRLWRSWPRHSMEMILYTSNCQPTGRATYDKSPSSPTSSKVSRSGGINSHHSLCTNLDNRYCSVVTMQRSRVQCLVQLQVFVLIFEQRKILAFKYDYSEKLLKGSKTHKIYIYCLKQILFWYALVYIQFISSLWLKLVW